MTHKKAITQMRVHFDLPQNQPLLQSSNEHSKVLKPTKHHIEKAMKQNKDGDGILSYRMTCPKFIYLI